MNHPTEDQVDALRDKIAELQDELDGAFALIHKHGKLLTDTVNVLRGPPPKLTMWSVHDVAERAAALKSWQVVATDALHAAERIAAKSHEYWDSDQDVKGGKLLIAVLDDTLKYSSDTDLFRAGVRQCSTQPKTGSYDECTSCEGRGSTLELIDIHSDLSESARIDCPDCGGSGKRSQQITPQKLRGE